MRKIINIDNQNALNGVQRRCQLILKRAADLTFNVNTHFFPMCSTFLSNLLMLKCVSCCLFITLCNFVMHK